MLHSLIMWLIVSSLSSHNLHLPFCYVLFTFALTKFVLMALFCAAIRRDSVSLLRFLFLCHVQVFSCEISLVCRLKYPYSCFSSHFYFLVIIIELIIALFVLYLVAAIILSLLFFYVVFESLCRYIDTSFNTGESSSYLFSFLTYTVCLHHFSDVRLYASSLVFLSWSICWRSSLVHFMDGPEYFTRGWTAQVFIFLIRCLLYSLVSSSFLVLQRYSLNIFFLHLRLFGGIRFYYTHVIISLLFFEGSDFFLIW